MQVVIGTTSTLQTSNNPGCLKIDYLAIVIF